MEQKSYIFEIVNELVRKPNHIRGIAKNLNINHMMIVRKIKLLECEKVIDFSLEGKNKVYFIKKSPELIYS